MIEREVSERWGAVPWALLHRWFIEYNPLYLISAALVLGGSIALSQGMVERGGLVAQLAISGIAEGYAWALVGGSALLVRIGLRRPAVMLALLVCLYQGDLTLHTETCVLLGPAGAVASAIWVGSFALKLRALAWAMRLRLSSSSVGIAVTAAVALAVTPWIWNELGPSTSAQLLAVITFGLFAAVLWTRRVMSSEVTLDAWGRTVARRAQRAVWAGWAVLWLVHVGFMMSQLPSGTRWSVFVPVVGLLFTRWLKTEARTWAWVAVVLVFTSLWDPASFAWTAVMAGAVLLLRALRCPTHEGEPPALWFLRSPPGVAIRLGTGAGICLYIAGWTAAWDGGAWPEPPLGWVVPFFLVALAGSRRFRSAVPALPGLAAITHYIVVKRIVPTPESTTAWGGTAVVAGFSLLLVGLLVSVRWTRARRRTAELPVTNHHIPISG